LINKNYDNNSVNYKKYTEFMDKYYPEDFGKFYALIEQLKDLSNVKLSFRLTDKEHTTLLSIFKRFDKNEKQAKLILYLTEK